ncbi:uncharacterized protein KY384_008665 [Bacidia gigantensis]|uniref:uncharacterized protein n=1 Tax=Bacidia gigantensis TaxID=2732470 RepID=UPI001D03FAF8|nr:uncharacterized protein KY384_008665 [Bacidia gigantensis]KAG8527235.1 hypothetical protein KY384_008665 [Bacidia gigantensis]
MLGWRIIADYLSGALLQPWGEPIRSRIIRREGLELYVSGYPTGGMINVDHVAWGFDLAFSEMENAERFDYGRYYFLLDDTRRGFLEFREATPHQTEDYEGKVIYEASSDYPKKSLQIEAFRYSDIEHPEFHQGYSDR